MLKKDIIAIELMNSSKHWKMGKLCPTLSKDKLIKDLILRAHSRNWKMKKEKNKFIWDHRNTHLQTTKISICSQQETKTHLRKFRIRRITYLSRLKTWELSMIRKKAMSMSQRLKVRKCHLSNSSTSSLLLMQGYTGVYRVLMLLKTWVI